MSNLKTFLERVRDLVNDHSSCRVYRNGSFWGKKCSTGDIRKMNKVLNLANEELNKHRLKNGYYESGSATYKEFMRYSNDNFEIGTRVYRDELDIYRIRINKEGHLIFNRDLNEGGCYLIEEIRVKKII